MDSPAVVKVPETPFKGKKEFADYALPGRLGQILAIVEAKRSSCHPLEGERQAADYADAILAKTGIDPFIFLANGDEIWFWHRGMGPPRKVSGFFTEDDLLRLAHLERFGKAVMQKAEVASLDALRQPPFTAIGDPEGLFAKSELEDLLDLTRSVAA